MKVALHSVGYSGTWGGETVLSVEDFVKKAASLGFDGVELMAKRPHLSPLDYARRDVDRLRELLSSLGLDAACVASYHDFSPSPDHPDMARVEKELVYLDRVMEIAAGLECKVVRTYSGYLYPGVDYRRQWETCVEALGEACSIAEDHGVYLGLQNHSPLSSFVDEVLTLVKDVGSNRLKVVLDAPLLVERGENLRESVLKCRRLIVHTHTSDFTYVYGRQPGAFFTFRRVMAVPLGRGVVDYRTFIKALKEIGYDGYLSYEMCSELEGGSSEENLDRLARIALGYTKSLIDR
mgnify:CR=1 FL=1